MLLPQIVASDTALGGAKPIFGKYLGAAEAVVQSFDAGWNDGQLPCVAAFCADCMSTAV